MGMFKEFKDFAMKGSIVDLATAVIIGGAFSKIVTSFVKDVLMPPVGLLMGDVDFKNLKYIIKEGVTSTGTDGIIKTTGEVAISYGTFIQTIIDFIIVAFCIFMVIRAYNKSKKKEKETPVAPPKQEVLLEEIRDLLKK